MTKEEAINVLNGILHLNYRNFWDEECDEAIDMAIEALSLANLKEEFESADAEFTDLPDIPRYYYEKVVGKMAHEINMLKEQLESADAVQGEWGHMMIDGNKLMLALSEWWYSSFGLEETEESKAIHKVMDEVERYVDHEKSADYWIPCSERLPKEKQEVYVTVYFIEGDTGRAYGYMDGFGRWHLYSTVEGTLNSGYEVTAWMPLPKPYREDGE